MKGKLLTHGGDVIATADIERTRDFYEGHISSLTGNADMLRLFEAYESAVLGQMLREVQELERQVDALGAIFVTESGYRFLVTDLQIYPSTMVLSFRSAANKHKHL